MAKEVTAEDQAFLDELTLLTKKHGIVIAGCGCCGSPFLYDLLKREERGRYEAKKHRVDVEWVVPKK